MRNINARVGDVVGWIVVDTLGVTSDVRGTRKEARSIRDRWSRNIPAFKPFVVAKVVMSK